MRYTNTRLLLLLLPTSHLRCGQIEVRGTPAPGVALHWVWGVRGTGLQLLVMPEIFQSRFGDERLVTDIYTVLYGCVPANLS